MDTISWLWGILNLIFLAFIPLLIKFLNDLKNFYIELKKDIIEHKVKIENLIEDLRKLEQDIKELREMTDNLLIEIKKSNGDKPKNQ